MLAVQGSVLQVDTFGDGNHPEASQSRLTYQHLSAEDLGPGRLEEAHQQDNEATLWRKHRALALTGANIMAATSAVKAA